MNRRATALMQARALVPLLRTMKAETVRGLIPTEDTLRQFDLLVRFHKRGAFAKPRGERRRLPEDVKAQILRGLRLRKPSSELERAFAVSYHTISMLRAEAGDLENRRHWKKLSAEQIQRATEMLKDGKSWRTVANSFHVALATLQKAVPYRKREARRDLAA